MTQALEITYLNGATDKTSPTESTTWSALVARFRASHRERDHFIKLSHEAFSPASRPPETRHTKANIANVTCAVWDLDAETPETLFGVTGWLKAQGAAYLVHTTASHMTEAKGGRGCWRVVSPLATPVDAKSWPSTWTALNRASGGANDPACKNADRIYFLPGWASGSDVVHTFHVEPGNPLDVSEMWRHAKPADVYGIQTQQADELTLRDIADRLARKRTNMVAAEIGRRMGDALVGRPYSDPGERDLWRLKIATAIVEEHPGLDPDTTAALFDQSHAAMDPHPFEVARRRESLAEKLTRLQLQRHGIPESYADLGDLEAQPITLDDDSDSQLVDWVVDRWGSKDHCVHTRGAFWSYVEGRGTWSPRPRSDVWDTLEALDGGIIGTGQKRRVFRRSTRQTSDVAKAVEWSLFDESFFNVRTPGVAFGNGFVSLESAESSLELRPHSPRNKATFTVPVDWDPEATCPAWLDVMGAVFRDDRDKAEKIKAFQEFLGAAIGGVATEYDRALVLSGSGSNGKSTVIKILELLFPDGATVSQTPQSWGGSGGNYAKAALASAAVNLCAEAPTNRAMSPEVIKAIISGDKIEARPIREAPFSFRPTAAHVWAVNSPWESGDNTKGYWRKFLVLSFNRAFDEESTPAGRRTDFVGRCRAELPGIYAWAFEGLRRLLAQGAYTMPDSAVDALEEWRVEADPISDWFGDTWAAVDPEDGRTKARLPTSRELMDSLVTWCASNAISPPRELRPKQLIRKLRAMPGGNAIRSVTTGGQVRYGLSRKDIPGQGAP